DIIFFLIPLHITWHPQTRDFRESASGYSDIIGGVVGGIPLWRHPIPPFIMRINSICGIMPVFTFRINNFTKPSSFIYFPHLKEVLPKTRGFEHHVFQSLVITNHL